jgi:hypothetical protein
MKMAMMVVDYKGAGGVKYTVGLYPLKGDVLAIAEGNQINCNNPLQSK